MCNPKISFDFENCIVFLVTYDDRTATPTSLILSSDMNPVAFEIRPDFDSDPALDDQLPYDPEL